MKTLDRKVPFNLNPPTPPASLAGSILAICT